jgi:hypothetical protein
MARRQFFEVQVIDAAALAQKLYEMGRRAINAKPAFEKVLDIAEAGQRRHFSRLGGRYVDTGALRASLTQPHANGAIREAHADEVEFGTSIYYARFLNKPGTSRRKKGSSAVLVLQPKAKREAGQALMDYITAGDLV